MNRNAVSSDITQAVVKNAGTTADQVTVSLVETPKTAKAKGGVLFSKMPGRGKPSASARHAGFSPKVYHWVGADAATSAAPG